MATSKQWPTPCRLRDDGWCDSYHPGHCVHVIPAGRIGQRPWGWRDAVVVRHDGLAVRLRTVEENVEFDAWHHRDLSGYVEPGSPVRFHEGWGGLSVLSGPFGIASIAHNSPLPEVPTPAHPELWTSEVQRGVVSNRTGYGVDLSVPEN